MDAKKQLETLKTIPPDTLSQEFLHKSLIKVLGLLVRVTEAAEKAANQLVEANAEIKRLRNELRKSN